MSDYIVQFKVKHGPMLRAMRRKGFQTAADLSRASGVSQAQIGLWLGLKQSPLLLSGDWRLGVAAIAEALGAMPSDLFPPQHIERPLAKNTAEVELSIDDLASLPGSIAALQSPEEHIIDKDICAKLIEHTEALSSRGRDVLERRFGLTGPEETLEQIAQTYGVSRERVRQMEQRALRQLRRPAVRRAIVEAGYFAEGDI